MAPVRLVQKMNMPETVPRRVLVFSVTEGHLR